MPKHTLSLAEQKELLEILQYRFEKNPHRHPGVIWTTILARLEASPEKLWSLKQMEETGGEPDIVVVEKNTDHFTYIDCSDESPKGRRSLCYDRQAHDDRKSYKPKDSAHDMANAMGVTMLSEDLYKVLQTTGEFDTKTSSWIETPEAIRKLGGAIFADRRYDHVFIYHNGASSYYASRGFRASLTI